MKLAADTGAMKSFEGARQRFIPTAQAPQNSSVFHTGPCVCLHTLQTSPQACLKVLTG